MWYTIEGTAQLYIKSCRSAGIVRKELEWRCIGAVLEQLELYWNSWSCTGTAGALLGQLELY
jgi:hypothetical protein